MDIPTTSPAALDALSASVRRVALTVLTERDGATTVDALAEAVVRRQSGRSTDGHADIDESLRSLYHLHLPVLGRTGAVTFDPESGLVATAREPPFDEAWVDRLVADHPDPSYDPLLSALASVRRQTVLYELFTGDATTPEELAVAVAAHERGGTAVPEHVAHVVRLSLTHTHLPTLAEAGFVVCNRADGRVRAGNTAWRSDPWVSLSPMREWAAVE